MATIAPRHFAPDAGLPGAGLPGDRQARHAAGHSFGVLKRAFHEALEPIAGQEASWLRAQVLSAEDPMDLWLLRAAVFAAVGGPERRPTRQVLRRALDSLFPDTQPASTFAPF